jgi:MFS family permease
MNNLRTFYTLVATQTLSLIGSRMTGIALGIWIFNETGNTTPLLLVAFFMTIPFMLGGSVAGVLADRFERRKLLMLSDFGQSLPTMALIAGFSTGNFEIWQLYVAAIIQAAFATVQEPAFAASMTLLVPDEQRDRANAIRQLTGPMAGIIAPVVTGLVYSLIGVVGVMAIDLTTFLFAGPMELLIPYIKTLTGSETWVGTLMGIWGGTKPRIHTIMIGLLMTSAAVMLYGVVRTPLGLGLALFFLLLPIPIVNALFMSILQAKVPPDMQGRVFSVVMQMAMLATPLSFLVTGPLVDEFFDPAVGVGAWEMVEPLVGAEAGSGMGLLIILTAAAYAHPKIRSMEADLPDYAAQPIFLLEDAVSAFGD